ncbi:hypothetical protein RvY_09186 [Ramazzottius varieornatus]|uniref:Transmembrane protein n=1 Tax=Ramazzottius varieornatus TaxID=947166 RepID=A0A1D1V8K2_RAMVA|nr:hypothetical protein RvY_09186 [Ramazzottius varieornatus]
MDASSRQNFVYQLIKDRTPAGFLRQQQQSQYSKASKRSATLNFDVNRRIKGIAFSLCFTILACVVATVLQGLALAGDDWGRYEILDEEARYESGHFGLFAVCIRTLLKKKFDDGCAVGQAGKFVLPAWCAISGICGVLCQFLIIVCTLTASVQLFRLVRNEAPCCCLNSRTLSQKAVCAIFIVIFACICLAFATLAMRRTVASSVQYGSSFWIQVGSVCASVILLVSTVIESLWRPYPHCQRPSRADTERVGSGRKQSFFPKGSFDQLENLEMMIHHNSHSKQQVVVKAIYEEKLQSGRIRHDAYRRSTSDAPAILAKVY